MQNTKKLGAAAFLPLLVFLALYVGCGLFFTVTGVESPFSQFPRHVAILGGLAVALAVAPGTAISEKLDVFTTNMGNSGVMMIILIYLMAGGFQGAAASMGGKESIINLSLHFIPVSLLIPGVFLMTGVIGIAQGTVGFFEWIQAIGGGMSDMFSISIMAAMINNTIGIIISAPIAKEIGAKYGISAKRLASLVDIFACAFLALMPHDGGMLIVTELANVSPLSVLKYSFYIFALILVTCATIQFSLYKKEN